MSKFLWILGGATLAVAAYVVMNQQLGITAPADGVDEAGNNLGAWGAKQRGYGVGGQLKGKLEQFGANVTGDAELGNKGVLDEAAGAIKNGAGKVAQAVGSTIHDINR